MTEGDPGMFRQKSSVSLLQSFFSMLDRRAFGVAVLAFDMCWVFFSPLGGKMVIFC